MMRCRKTPWIAVVMGAVCGLAVLGDLAAQTPKATRRPAAVPKAPHIDSLFPPGAQVGKTTDWTFTGTNLSTVKNWLVSGSGVKITGAAAAPNRLTAQVEVEPGAEPGVRELYASGPDGISNLVLFRVDTLPQTAESEPNDTPEKANRLAVGAVICGVLKAEDVDYYRVEATAGQRVVIDLEAQRLGIGLVPVVTVMTASGRPLVQGREPPGPVHDCQLDFRFPSAGDFLIEVRDNAYLGADSAAYRLRLDEAPFATGLFPLGGTRGETITLSACGGNLTEPLTQQVKLPEEAGASVDVPPFETPRGPVLAPARLIVGDGPEMTEPPSGPDRPKSLELPELTTVNGRIEKPGEIDRYTIKVKKKDAIQIVVQAEALGSWLDSVVTLKDSAGKTLAENDDPVTNRNPRGGIIFGIASGTTDSRLDYTPAADGSLTVEVTDRYGFGGPEYGYRLTAGPGKPDFALSLIIINANGNRRVVDAAKKRGPATTNPTGVFNLRPGARIPVNFLVTPERFKGKVVVSAEGLPPGVSAEPVTVAVGNNVRGPQPAGGAIVLKAQADAEPGVGTLQLMARGKPENGPEIVRTATTNLTFDPLPSENPGPFGSRPLVHRVARLPVAVLKGNQTATAKKGPRGKTKAVAVALKEISKPPVLLLGAEVELSITFDPPAPPPDSFRLDAEAQGKGLVTQTVIADADASESDPEARSVIRILASPKAETGRKHLRVTFEPKIGQRVEKELPLDVRAPIELTVPAVPVVLVPGGTTTLPVKLKREAGFDKVVELELVDLPKGVRAPGPLKVEAGQTALDVRLEMESGAERLERGKPFRVRGLARMPRGLVRVDSAIRPMLISHLAEK